MYKKPTQANGNGYSKELVKMMDNTQNCLNCGRPLRYYIDRNKRSNRGYCCKECYLAKPPRLAYIEHKEKTPIKQLILSMLNKNDNISATAELLGTNREMLFIYIKKLRIKRTVMWEG